MSPTAPGFAQWLQSPLGRYALEWEQTQVDRMVGDIFGYHALQLGMPELRGLHGSRMPHRWLARAASADGSATTLLTRAETLLCDFDELPFPERSLDLVVLPHTLELAADPHACLREVERVLVAGGQLIITGFNPYSLWGARQSLARFGARPPLPQSGEWLTPYRVRDWLRLLSLEVDGGRFGCYRPALRSQTWLQRWSFLEAAGDRWWPMLGGTYLLLATKRVRAMRLLGPPWSRTARKLRATQPLVQPRTTHTSSHPIQIP